MLRAPSGGASIAVEVWLVPPAGIAAILLSEPDGLCVGRVTLDDGSEVLGVLAEPALVEGQPRDHRARRLARVRRRERCDRSRLTPLSGRSARRTRERALDVDIGPDGSASPGFARPSSTVHHRYVNE